MAHQLAYMWMEANPGRDMVITSTVVARVTLSTGAAWPGLGQHLRHLLSPAWQCKNDGLLGSFSSTFRPRWSCAMSVSTTGWVRLLWSKTVKFSFSSSSGNTIFILPDLKIAYLADIVTPKRWEKNSAARARVGCGCNNCVTFLFHPGWCSPLYPTSTWKSGKGAWKNSYCWISRRLYLLCHKCKYLMISFQGSLFPQLRGEPSGWQQAGRGGGTSGLQWVRLHDFMTTPQFMRDLKDEVMSMLMQGLSTAKVGGARCNLDPEEP